MDLNPQMREDVDMVLSLIEREVTARRQRGEKPEINEYLRRFPSQEREIRTLFERVQTQMTGQSDTARSIERDTPPRYDTNLAMTAMPPGGGGPQQTPSRRGGGPSSMTSMASVHIMQCAREHGFEILSELGRGGMGVVYKAQQLGLKRMVALKMILAGAHASAEQMARFRAEAEAVAKLQHPNIVQVYDVGELDGNPFLALEFVDGGSLEDRLKGQPMPPLQAAMLVEPLARAAHAAHLLSIVHRDLKPANILLTSDGTPKISDFGLVKHMDDSSGWTRTGDIMGTPCYMAPEQAEGKIKKIGGHTDVYSLGAILYELLTARPPFLGSSTLETLELVRSQDPFPVSKFAPNVPRDLETITMKCLEKEPKNRYMTGEELADDLKRFLCDEPILAKPPGFMTRFSRWSKRNPTGAGALISVILLVLVAAGMLPLLLTESDKPRDELARNKSTPSVSNAGNANSSKPQPSLPETRPSATTLVPTESSPRIVQATSEKSPTRVIVPTRRVEPPPPPPTYPELIAKARAARSPQEALDNYLKALVTEKDRPRLSEVEQYRQLVGPAIDSIKQIKDVTDPVLLKRIAALYALKGDLIIANTFDFDEAKLFTKNMYEEALDAYALAIKNHQPESDQDQPLAQYYTKHGLAAFQYLRDLKEDASQRAALNRSLEEDARQAVRYAPEFAGGWNLQGFVQYLKYKDAKPEDKKSFLQDALRSYSKAIENADPKVDDQYASYFINRSDAYLNLGILAPTEAQKKDLLQNALKDAKNATEAKPNYTYTWFALGIAHEVRKEYPQACEAYKQQHKTADYKADGMANLGRAQARWYFDSRNDPDLLEQAIVSLRAAIRKDRRRVDSNYWLGRLLFQKNETKEAIERLNQAFEDATLGEILKKDLLAYYAGKPEALRKLFGEFLPAEPNKWTAKHARFLLARAQLTLDEEDKKKPEDKDLRKEQPQSIADANDVVRLSKDRALQAAALELLGNARLRIVNDNGQSGQRRLGQIQPFITDRRKLVRDYPEYENWLSVANELLKWLEDYGESIAQEPSEKKKYFTEAREIAIDIRKRLDAQSRRPMDEKIQNLKQRIDGL